MADLGIVKLFNEWSLLGMIAKLSFAVIAGGLIGIDRSLKRRGAGIKTHTIVCLGATLVMMTGQYIYMNFDGSNYIDRLPAQVITGVGFLGVGTILVTGKNRVKGLTTAAGLWTCACVGLAIGIGFVEGAAFTVILMLLIFRFASAIDNKLEENCKYLDMYLEFATNKDVTLFISKLKKEDIKMDSFELYKSNVKGEGPNAVITVIIDDKEKRANFAHDVRKLDYIGFAERV